MSQDYPKVYRTADPLLIRPCRLALQVDDTTYYAKVKFGNKFCGYYIYANATGLPASNQYSTSYDVSLLLKEIIKHPLYY